MLASSKIAVIGAFLVGSLVIEPAAAASNLPLWETRTCASTGGWRTFTPKSEGDLPACHPDTRREWKVCEESGRTPLYAHWCPAKAAPKSAPKDFRP